MDHPHSDAIINPRVCGFNGYNSYSLSRPNFDDLDWLDGVSTPFLPPPLPNKIIQSMSVYVETVYMNLVGRTWQKLIAC